MKGAFRVQTNFTFHSIEDKDCVKEIRAKVMAEPYPSDWEGRHPLKGAFRVQPNSSFILPNLARFW